MGNQPTARPHGRWILAIEASSAHGSVALFRDNALAGTRVVPMGASTDDALFPAVIGLLSQADLRPDALAQIVCGEGPGSFTSLRIAAAVAKGLAHAVGMPLYAVSSLLLAAAAYHAPGRYLVHSDALRGDRYAMPVTVRSNGDVEAEGDMVRRTTTSLLDRHDGRALLWVGDKPPGAPGNQVLPDAANLLRVLDWQGAGPVSLQGWEPTYGRLAEAQVKWEAAHQQPLRLGS